MQLRYMGHISTSEMSLGDDLEELIDDIKTNDTRIFYNRKWDNNYSFRDLFQISSLTKDEKKQLESKDSSFKEQFLDQKPDVPKAQMDLSESQTKYRLSVAMRRTILIVDCLKKCPVSKVPIKICCRSLNCYFCVKPYKVYGIPHYLYGSHVRFSQNDCYKCLSTLKTLTTMIHV